MENKTVLFQLLMSLLSGLGAGIISVAIAINQWYESNDHQRLTSYKQTIIELMVFKENGRGQLISQQDQESSQDKLKSLRALTSDTILKLKEKNQVQLVKFLESVRLLEKEGPGLLAENNLSDAKLRQARMASADLSRSTLSEADLRKANLANADLRGANLANADLMEANLKGGDLSWFVKNHSSPNVRTNLSNADLNGADLNGANLNGANLKGTNLSNVKLEKASFKHAIYDQETDINNSKDLVGAYKIEKEADLNGANLSSVDLSKVDLEDAHLKEANLSFANLRDANLRGAELSGADLSGADLRGAKVSNDVKSLATLCSTIWVNGEIENPQDTCNGIKIPYSLDNKLSIAFPKVNKSNELVRTIEN